MFRKTVTVPMIPYMSLATQWIWHLCLFTMGYIYTPLRSFNAKPTTLSWEKPESGYPLEYNSEYFGKIGTQRE